MPSTIEATETGAAVYPSLKGKRVLITGGGSGIGATLVEAFVAQDAQVAFFDIAEQESLALVEKLRGRGAHAPQFTCVDLRDIDAIQQAIGDVEQSLGGVDVLVNNAGNDDRHKIENVTADYWDDRIAVNLKHMFFASQAAVRPMQRNGGGVILNLGSLSWHEPHPDMPLYQTAKAGVEGMTRALARDLGEHNIRVNTVVPGAVKTPRQDMHWHDDKEVARILENQCLKARVMPEDVAALTLFLASDDARMCTAHAYWVDAGWN